MEVALDDDTGEPPDVGKAALYAFVQTIAVCMLSDLR